MGDEPLDLGPFVGRPGPPGEAPPQPAEPAMASSSVRVRIEEHSWFATVLAVAAVPCLMVVSFLFGRWSAETPTIVPAPKVYVVPADSLATTTTSSVVP